MTRAFEDALVAGHEPLISTMTNHPKDRPFEIDAIHPDEFLLNQFDLDPDRVLAALTRQVTGDRHPPATLIELSASLRRSHLPRFAARLQQLADDNDTASATRYGGYG
jgi:hypothetical protein